MRVTIRVRPRSRRIGVGGEFDGALIIRVAAPASDGAANAAALSALAGALEVRRSDVVLVSGAAHRTKIVDIPAAAAARFEALRNADRGRTAG